VTVLLPKTIQSVKAAVATLLRGIADQAETAEIVTGLGLSEIDLIVRASALQALANELEADRG
jgi:hypothetical protein